MLRRIVIVMFLFLTGCGLTQPSVVTIPPQETLVPLVPNVVVPLSGDLSYIVPDPYQLWTVAGTDLQSAHNFTTRIQINYVLKPQDNTPLSEILPTLTAENLEIQEGDGVQYAEGSTPVSDYVLYVDKGDYVVIFTLFDAATDDIDAQYIASWRSISLEGELVRMD